MGYAEEYTYLHHPHLLRIHQILRMRSTYRFHQMSLFNKTKTNNGSADGEYLTSQIIKKLIIKKGSKSFLTSGGPLFDIDVL